MDNVDVESETLTVRGAELVVDSLIQQGVTHVFAIPGAKIDAVFDALKDRGPKLIVCRHEQNAVFMAAAIGRLTGKPGVCLVTSGPGASNLATGLLTANKEGDPVVALAGAVKRSDLLKNTHQSMDNVALFQSITKYSAEVEDSHNIPEAITNAFRVATSGVKGATFLSFPQDVVLEQVKVNTLKSLSVPKLGSAPEKDIDRAIATIRKAHFPVVLVGMRGGRPETVGAVRQLLRKWKLPFVETYQAAGTLSHDLEEQYFGRIGLFHNQPGDMLLEKSDVVLTIGYNPIEYDPVLWNQGKRIILHLDAIQADVDFDYQPEIELVGDITETLEHMTQVFLPVFHDESFKPTLRQLQKALEFQSKLPRERKTDRVHPLQIIYELRKLVDDDTTITCDVGSHAIWMARYFRCYRPLGLLFSNGMQTLGVALPWAIASTLVHPGKKVISVSGDGGFLFSSMELETAVRLKAPIVHLVWNDSSYDMVAFQQQMKYNRTSGIEFGSIDVVKYAESFGAKGFRVNSSNDLSVVLRKAIHTDGPVLIDIPVDYSDNIHLADGKFPRVSDETYVNSKF